MATSKSKAKPKRKNHFISQFYLAGFTQSGLPKDRIYEMDFTIINTIENPRYRLVKEVGYMHDFYRVDLPNRPIDYMEDEFGKLESKVGIVLKKILNEKRLPGSNEDDYKTLIKFIALMTVKVPSFKADMVTRKIELPKRLLNQEAYERYIKLQKINNQKNISYKDYINQIEKSVLRAEKSKNFFIEEMLRVSQSRYPVLLQRKWSLIINENESEHFICSDCPAGLNWNSDKFNPKLPSYLSSDTTLIMPLNKNTAIKGTFADQPEIQTITDPYEIALINASTIFYAERFIYSLKKNFIYLNENDQIVSCEDLSRFKDIQKSLFIYGILNKPSC